MSALELSPGRLGHSLTEVVVAGTRVNHATYRAGTTTPPHVHPRGDLCVTLQGRYEERWRGGGRTIDSGTVVLKPAGVEHVDRFGSEDVTCLNVEFTPEAWSEHVRADLDAPFVVVDPKLARLASELELELTAPDRLSPIAAEGLVLTLLATALRGEERERCGGDRWLGDVRDRLHAEYARTLHLDDLAAGVGVRPSHLARRFRRRYGRSVGRYLREVRVAAALRALAEADRELADVAAATGFSDQSHMGRVVRRETGATPGQWRARLRSSGSTRPGSF